MNARPKSQSDPIRPEIEFALRGLYQPGLFHLHLKICEDLAGIGRLPESSVHPYWMPTFLHEYIHFLQDVSTTHGLLNIIHYIEFLKNANKQIRESESADFQIPVVISNAYNWNTNRDLKRIYLGDPDKLSKHIVYSSYRSQMESVPTGNGATLPVHKYWVDYHDRGAQVQDSVHFGSIHLKEFMAHAVQEQFDPSTKHSDLPYGLVKLLVEKEAPALSADVRFIIALCDAALMAYHPADLFFNTIGRIKASPGWNPTSVESVYEFTFHGLRPEGHDDFDALFDSTAQAAAGHFNDALKSDIYKNNVKWFEEIISQAKEARLMRRGFFSRLIDSEGVVSKEFKTAFAALGAPFTTNADGKGWFIPPAKLRNLAIQTYYPKAFEAVMRTYCGYSDCSLMPVCRAYPDRDVTDENCSCQPWIRVGYSDLCPYAQMWKTWGLAGRTPQLRTT